MRRSDDGRELPGDLWRHYHTLNTLFEWIAKAFEQNAARIATLTAEHTYMEPLQPDHVGPIGISEWPSRDPQAPSYPGAALLVTKTLGQTQEWPIPIIHPLP